jgi:hypothetical protein
MLQAIESRVWFEASDLEVRPNKGRKSVEKEFYGNVRTQRFLVWLTLALTVVFSVAYVGLMRFFPPPAANLPADQVAELYRAHNVQFRVGVILGLISGGFLLPLTLVISIQMARLERGVPIWALMQGAAGALGITFIWLPVLIWGVAAFSAERAPELTLLMHEFGWLTFITPLSLFPLQLLGIIIVAFAKAEDDRYSAFPRWIGYLTALVALESFCGPMAMLFKTGIFSWAGLLPFYLPFFLFFGWIAAICFTILRALRQQERGAAGLAKAA